jgi:hypothetical protein
MPVLLGRRMKIKELRLSGRMLSAIGQTPAFAGSHRFNSGLTMADERDPVVSSLSRVISSLISAFPHVMLMLPRRHFSLGNLVGGDLETTGILHHANLGAMAG